MSGKTFAGEFERMAEAFPDLERLDDKALDTIRLWLAQMEQEQTERGLDGYAMWVGAFAMYNTFTTLRAYYTSLMVSTTVCQQPALILVEWARQLKEEGGLQPVLNDETLQSWLEGETDA